MAESDTWWSKYSTVDFINKAGHQSRKYVRDSSVTGQTQEGALIDESSLIRCFCQLYEVAILRLVR